MSTPQEWPEQNCQCIECGGDMQPTLGTLEYDLEDMTIVVEGVPMIVCHDCGERVIPGIPAMEIDEAVQNYVQTERSQNVMDRATLHYCQRDEGRQLAYAD